MAPQTRITSARVSYLTEYAEQMSDESTDEFVMPADLSTLGIDELNTLHEQAVNHFDTVYADGTNFTEDDVTTLTELVSGIEALSEEMTKRNEEAAALAAKANALASKIKGEGEVESADEQPADQQAPDSSQQELSANVVRVNLGSRGRRAPQPQREVEQEASKSMRDVVFASGQGSAFAEGTGLNWSEVGEVMRHRLAGFNRTAFAAAANSGRHISRTFGVANFQKPIPEDMKITASSSPEEVDAILRKAMNESRLKGGSLVAAGGWCTPSETLYDLCELESRDGIFSLPEIGVTRGGIRRTLGPDFATLYNSQGFYYTEADDIAGDYDGNGGGTKPCIRVECPEWEDIRLDIVGLCVSAGILASKSFPEMLARTTRGVLVGHDHRIAANVLSKVAAGSTKVTMPTVNGATAQILTAIELQAEHMKYTGRLARGTSLEAVFPYWTLGVIRSDLAQRQGVDMLSVSDTQIRAWFTARGIAPQFVYNFQDLNTVAAGTFTAWPNEVSFLMYPAGTWVQGSADIITMEGIYDSSLLAVNDFTALFTEEGTLVAKMCHDSRFVTVPLCANGATHAGEALACRTTDLTPAPVGFAGLAVDGEVAKPAGTGEKVDDNGDPVVEAKTTSKASSTK